MSHDRARRWGARGAVARLRETRSKISQVCRSAGAPRYRRSRFFMWSTAVLVVKSSHKTHNESVIWEVWAAKAQLQVLHNEGRVPNDGDKPMHAPLLDSKDIIRGPGTRTRHQEGAQILPGGQRRTSQPCEKQKQLSFPPLASPLANTTGRKAHQTSRGVHSSRHPRSGTSHHTQPHGWVSNNSHHGAVSCTVKRGARHQRAGKVRRQRFKRATRPRAPRSQSHA